MNLANRLHLLFWTVRYLTPLQVWHRGRRIIRQRWWRLIKRQAPQPTHWSLNLYHPLCVGLSELAYDGPWSKDVANAINRAKDVAKQRFLFLNQTVNFDKQPDWHDSNLSHLFRYNLHYFDYIRALIVWSATDESDRAYQTLKMLVNSWIDSNQVLEGDGWHPYTISLRLVNWLHAISGFKSQLEIDECFKKRLLSSLYGQAQILFANLELDVRGNHLLENLRALLWAGITFKGSEPQRWFQRALTLLRQELAEQVQTDGGHFERSPSYHIVVLRNCLEIGLWLRRNKNMSLPWLDDTLRRMAGYLLVILPPNEQIPLVKDTTWDTTPPAFDLLVAIALYFNEPKYKQSNHFGLYPLLLFGYTGWEQFKQWPQDKNLRTPQALIESGYYIMRDDEKGEHLIFDAGKPCPDYLPAHAHADLLSYELSIDGQRVIVDSGVYEYTTGSWRDYFRSTRAHNTVEVSNENQSEVWSSFRVARRAQPGKIEWQQTDKYVLIQAQHNGYHRLPIPVTHRRTIVWQKGCFWLIVDELWGREKTVSDSYIHLHPNLDLDTFNESIWQIRGEHLSSLWLTVFNQQSYSILRGQTSPLRQGWYSERFGQLRSNTVLALHNQTDLPFSYGYVISRGQPVQVYLSTPYISDKPQKGKEKKEMCQITIKHIQYSYSLDLPKHAPPNFR